jgi:anthranilate synthase/aminodeoxychorismate synthase-like glutamine amidotransferase
VHHFGGDIVRAGRLMHGKTSLARHDGKTIFDKLPQPLEVGRYHSLCAEHDTLPDVLELTAETDRGEIMGVRHKELPLEGVQFHPESVLTPAGNQLLANFLRMNRP